MFIKQNKYKYIVQFEGDCAYFTKYITLLLYSIIPSFQRMNNKKFC